MQPSQEIGEVVGKERAVDIEAVGEFFESPVHHIVVGLVLHQRQHFLAVAANHLSVAPGDGSREQRHNLDVGQRLKHPRELHRVVGNKILAVDACYLAVEQFDDFRFDDYFGSHFLNSSVVIPLRCA